MVDFEFKDKYDVYDLKRLVAALRGEGGCPWDMEQTHTSIRRDFLEETYEAVEAIDEGSLEHLREELGDVLLQVIFHAGIEEDAGTFDLDEVADAECKKLIFRHPHVFGDAQADNAGQVLDMWDSLKRTEKSQDTVASTLDAVARSLPALWRAEKVQKKAGKVGFDRYGYSGAMDKLSEELEEIRNAGAEDIKEELGDMLFSLVSMCRFAKGDPEALLHDATDKFIRRFNYVEKCANDSGRDIKDLSNDEMEAFWTKAKENGIK